MKVLNLYAGIGGNRKLWKDVDVTAVEINPDIAKIYQDFFPDDKVIISDAHQYLLEHFKEFDFIWSSPPCPSHSDVRRMGVDIGQNDPLFPDMKLYEEIIFLKQFFKGKWVVENVKSYYKPLIKPNEIDRHYLWSNFHISKKNGFQYKGNIIKGGHTKELQIAKDVSIDGYAIRNRRRDAVLRIYINPKLGRHVYNCAFKLEQKRLV